MGEFNISKEERERIEQASQAARQGFAEAREIDALIGYYGFMDRDDLETCANAVPDLFANLDAADEQIADLQRENEQLRDKLTSTDAERRFWENEAAMVADSLVNPDEEDDADDEDVL